MKVRLKMTAAEFTELAGGDDLVDFETLLVQENADGTTTVQGKADDVVFALNEIAAVEGLDKFIEE